VTSAARLSGDGVPMKVGGDAKAILIAGLVGGVLDIVFAFIYYGNLGVSPARILRSVASGVVGTAARTGGVGLAAFGLLLHLLISVAAAAVFYAASRRFPWLLRHIYVAGIAFGLSVYFVMGYVVVPLSAFPFKGSGGAISVPVLLANVFLFGLPIALCIRQWSGPSARQTT
jgi:hypothetical protein